MCVYFCVQVEGKGQSLLSFFKCHPPCFLETGSLFGLELANEARLAGQQALGSAYFCLPRIEI